MQNTWLPFVHSEDDPYVHVGDCAACFLDGGTPVPESSGEASTMGALLQQGSMGS